MSKTLAVKYRPETFDDVVEQDSIKTILQEQLKTNTTKNAYLFCGGAGTGKTTCARIFADEINKHEGTPIEMDAASNSGVDDVRAIIKQAQTKSIDSDYKIFIIDECHSLSNTAWQAFLKLIEEPPAKTVFIFCTTDPQKIPKTILSRVQRYDFQRISTAKIKERLLYILDNEINEDAQTIGQDYSEACEYIAKIADGGMRDAITMLDKCLSLSNDLTLDNVIKALGVANYELMHSLTLAILNKDTSNIISIIENIHNAGKDLKTFIRHYMNFILDNVKYNIAKDDTFIQVPVQYTLNADTTQLLKTLVVLNEKLKYDITPKQLVESTLLLEVLEENR